MGKRFPGGEGGSLWLVSEFFEARVRAEWPDWTFGAHQAAARAAASEQLVALRRRYGELTERELAELASSWPAGGSSGPYFSFAAAADYFADPGTRGHDGAQPGLVAVSAAFVKALLRELRDQAPAALAALLDRWAEQRRNADLAGARSVRAHIPRVALLLPRDESGWPARSWQSLSELDLDDARFDGTTLRWDAESERWLAVP
jgi:hypothetical protein